MANEAYFITLASRCSSSLAFSDFWMHTRKSAAKYSSENWYMSPIMPRSAMVK